MSSIREYKKKNNQIIYRAEVRIKGFKPVRKSFYDIDPKKAKKAAKIWADEIELNMQKGTYKENPIAKHDISTISQLIEYYDFNVAKNKYSHYEKYATIYNWWKNQIGNVKVTDLTTAMLSSCKNTLKHEKIKKGNLETNRSANTINKYLMCFSAILSYASNELELIQHNPMSKVKLEEKPKGRTRFLSLDEIAIFLKACKDYSPTVYLFVMLLISTGARYSEVLQLCVENIDRDNLQVHFLNTKNGEHRGVPINKDVLDLISEYLKENNIKNGIIFRAKRSNAQYPYIKKAIEDIKKNIDTEYFTIHDLRHTTASYIAMNGGSLLDIAEILGHKSLSMARRYSHLTQKHTASLLNKVTAKILPNN